MPYDPKAGEHDLASILTLELLFRTEMDFVMNTARRHGLSDADAEDVAQRVFITLQRRLHTLQSPESVRPWLATVTRRLALSFHGAQAREPTEPLPSDLGEIEDEAPMPEEQMLRSEERRELLDLLETIEPGRRAILVMHVLDELPVPEIAETLRIPVTTAYNRLRLARQDLREAFARKNVADEFGMLCRAWERVFMVRDPSECFYGRIGITQAVRDRVWARVVDGLRQRYPSFEIAERRGLRVFSPLWKTNAPPRPYARLKRPRKLAKAAYVGLPPRRVAGAATGSRTP